MLYVDNNCIFIVPMNSTSLDVSQSGSTVAGSEFTWTCSVSETISGFTNMPSAVWLLADNNVPVPSGGDITITTTRSNNTATAILNFNPLRTSHGAVYLCRGTLMSPAQDGLIQTMKQIDLNVQRKI